MFGLFWWWTPGICLPVFWCKNPAVFVNNLHNQFPWIRACGGTACNLSTKMLDSCTLLFEEVYVNHAAYEEQRSTTISCSAALVASQDPYATSHRNRQFPSTEKILPGKTLMWWICHVLLQRYHLFDHIFGFTSKWFFQKTEIPELIGVFMALFCSSCSTSKVGICWDDEKWPSHGQAWWAGGAQ